MLRRYFMLGSSNPIASKVFNPTKSVVHQMGKVFLQFCEQMTFRDKIQLSPSKYCFSLLIGTRPFHFFYIDSVRLKFSKISLTCYCKYVSMVAEFGFWLFSRVVDRSVRGKLLIEKSYVKKDLKHNKRDLFERKVKYKGRCKRRNIWGKVFKNGPSEIFGETAFKKFEVIWSALNFGCLPQISLGSFLKTLSHSLERCFLLSVQVYMTLKPNLEY